MIADEIKSLFDNPHRLWMQVYTSLSLAGQALFATSALLDTPCELARLEASISAAHPQFRTEILGAERELDDTFLTFARHPRRRDVETVDFVNPSIQDFAYRVLEQNPEVLRPYLSQAIYFIQLAKISELAGAASRRSGSDFPKIREWTRSNAPTIAHQMIKLGRGYTDLEVTLDFISAYCQLEHFPTLVEHLRDAFSRFDDARVYLLGRIILRQNRRLVIERHIDNAYLERAIEWAAAHAEDADDVDTVLAIQRLRSNLSDADFEHTETLRRTFLELAADRARALGEDEDTEWSLRNELEEFQRLARSLDCDISDVELEFENHIENMPPEDEDYDEDDRRDAEPHIAAVDDEAVEIDHMFLTLIDRD